MTSDTRYPWLASVICSVSPKARRSAAASPSMSRSQYGPVPACPCRVRAGGFGRAVLDLRDPGRDRGRERERAEDIRFGKAARHGERAGQRAAVVKVPVAGEVAALFFLLDARRGADKQPLGVAGGRNHALVGDDRLERRRVG
jgi:hypothetical protein